MYLDVCLLLWSFLGQAQPTAAATAPVVGATKAAAAGMTSFTGMGVLRYVLMVLYLMVCVGLIVVVLNKNTKNDGLAGMLGGGGGASQSTYRGKKSFEENLTMVSNYLAVSFIVLSLVISLVMH